MSFIDTLMKNIFWTFVFIFSGSICTAQDKQPISPAAKFLTSFPFKQYNGGVMLVRATFGNLKDSFNFILDTGCGGISLDSTTCARYHIIPTPSDTTINGMGSSAKVGFVFNQSLHFKNLTIENLNFHVTNYDILTSVYGEDIDGIIGYSFFSKYLVKINFDSSMIEVYSPGKMKYERRGVLLHPKFTNTIPIQDMTIIDRKKLKFNFYFDTGAGLNFLMNEAFVNDSEILAKGRKVFETQAEGISGKVKMHLTVIKSIRLGKYKFRNVPTYIYSDSLNVTAYPFSGGLIGNDLLRRFNLILNYPNKEIYLFPNKQFSNVFDYAYTGITIYFDEGNILVDDVIVNSPGALAGLRKDDKLFSVGNDYSNNIIQYKNLLQAAKEKINIFVRRNNQLIELVVKPISIL